MAAEWSRIQFGRARDVNLIGRAAADRGGAPMIIIRDLRRDWRRWSAAERVCAAALSGLWVAGITTAILADTLFR
jgi:hypothetical protein